MVLVLMSQNGYIHGFFMKQSKAFFSNTYVTYLRRINIPLKRWIVSTQFTIIDTYCNTILVCTVPVKK